MIPHSINQLAISLNGMKETMVNLGKMIIINLHLMNMDTQKSHVVYLLNTKLSYYLYSNY